jgi:hypothetical protein
MAKRKGISRSQPPAPLPRVDQLLGDLRGMIEAARARVASTANTELTLLDWRIGRKIHAEILSGERAPYGAAILATLSQHLAAEYGRGFTYTALTRMASFFEAFPDEAIVAALSQQLRGIQWQRLRRLKYPFRRQDDAGMRRIRQSVARRGTTPCHLLPYRLAARSSFTRPKTGGLAWSAASRTRPSGFRKP